MNAIFTPLTASAATFADVVNKQIVPLGNTVVELLYAVAFLFFIYGVATYFFKTGDPAAREKGKQVALYGIIGLFVLFAVWGLVGILLNTLTSVTTA